MLVSLVLLLLLASEKKDQYDFVKQSIASRIRLLACLVVGCFFVCLLFLQDLLWLIDDRTNQYHSCRLAGQTYSENKPILKIWSINKKKNRDRKTLSTELHGSLLSNNTNVDDKKQYVSQRKQSRLKVCHQTVPKGIYIV